MDQRSERRIFDWLKRLQARSLTRHIGVVDDAGPPLIVIIGDQPVECSKLDGYSPTNGDRVWVSRSGRDLVVHDSIT